MWFSGTGDCSLEASGLAVVGMKVGASMLPARSQVKVNLGLYEGLRAGPVGPRSMLEGLE